MVPPLLFLRGMTGKGTTEMFGKKKETLSYDKTAKKPVIHCSICTGEQAAGFKDLKTGKFTEIMLIKTPGDLEKFKTMYGLDEVEKDY